jgi:uncharacterized protein YprB with RNaseH-like and TPR domain
MDHPKVLFLDIETAPMLGYVWSLWDNNVGLNQLESDWYVLAWAAKWLGSKKIIYMDQRDSKDIEDDKKILKELWKLIDEADILVTHNGKQFDEKKINSRFILHGFKPPSSYKHIDTCELAKRKFGFTSNKLEYLSCKLCKNKKGSHKRYPGFDLWKACLKGDNKAWAEMKKYNKLDVITLEQLYDKLIPWDSTINFNLYNESEENVCKCGCTEFAKNGYAYTQVSKFQRYKCKQCGAEVRGRVNLFSKEKRASLRVKVRN